MTGQVPCDVCTRQSCYGCALEMACGSHECNNDQCMLYNEGSCSWGLSERCGASGRFMPGDEEDEE